MSFNILTCQKIFVEDNVSSHFPVMKLHYSEKDDIRDDNDIVLGRKYFIINVMMEKISTY